MIRKGFVNSRVVGVALEVGESKRKRESEVVERHQNKIEVKLRNLG